MIVNRCGVADGQRHEGEVVEDALEEGQVHFQRMLLGVRGVAENDLRQIGDLSDCCLVEPNIAERRGECFGFGQRQAVDRNPVRRAEQNDPVDARAPR